MALAPANRINGMTAKSKIASLFFGLLLVFQPALAASAEEKECHLPKGQYSDSSPEANRKYFEQHFIIAEHFRQAAATAGAQWLKTEDLLIRSRITAGNGDWSTAQQLVHKACLQAVSALQQAEYESEAWKSRVVN